jgi:hypothetical protein
MSQRVTRSTASQMLFNENSNDSDRIEDSGDDSYTPRQERAAPKERTTRTSTGGASHNWLSKNRGLKTKPYKFVKDKVGNFYAPHWVKRTLFEDKKITYECSI